MNARVFQVRGAWYWCETFSEDADGVPQGPFDSAIQAGASARKAIVMAASVQPIVFQEECSLSHWKAAMTLPDPCDAMLPFIPRMGLSYACGLPKGHAGNHSSGAMQWPQAPDAAAAPSITTTFTVPTNHTRSNEAIAPGPEPTIIPGRDMVAEVATHPTLASQALLSMQSQLAEKDAEIARLGAFAESVVKQQQETTAYYIKQRAELEALVREASYLLRDFIPNYPPGLSAVVRSRALIKSVESLLEPTGNQP